MAARPWKIWMPGSCSSRRMTPESSAPITPAMIAKMRYIVPMSLWLVE